MRAPRRRPIVHWRAAEEQGRGAARADRRRAGRDDGATGAGLGGAQPAREHGHRQRVQVAQLQSNLGALAMVDKLAPEVLARIDAITAPLAR